jgi:hypothetical protein
MPMGQLMGVMGKRLGGLGRGKGSKKIFKMVKKVGKFFEGFYRMGYKNGAGIKGGDLDGDGGVGKRMRMEKKFEKKMGKLEKHCGKMAGEGRGEGGRFGEIFGDDAEYKMKLGNDLELQFPHFPRRKLAKLLKKNPEMTKDGLAEKISEKIAKRNIRSIEFDKDGSLALKFSQMREVFPHMPDQRLKKLISKNSEASPEDLIQKIVDKMPGRPFFQGGFRHEQFSNHFNPQRR